MSCEVSLNSIRFDENEKACEPSFSSFAHDYTPIIRASTSVRSVPDLSKRTITFLDKGITPLSNVKGEAGVTITWGGENGTEISGYASGSASDDRGNKAGVTFEINDDGSGKASVSASHEHSTDSQKK